MNDPLFPKSPADLLPTEEALKLDGLEYMQGLLDGKLPAATISETLNYRLSEVEEGKITFRGSPQFNALNPMGTVHGGWYGTATEAVSNLMDLESDAVKAWEEHHGPIVEVLSHSRAPMKIRATGRIEAKRA